MQLVSLRLVTVTVLLNSNPLALGLQLYVAAIDDASQRHWVLFADVREFDEDNVIAQDNPLSSQLEARYMQVLSKVCGHCTIAQVKSGGACIGIVQVSLETRQR
jgi:hypothetical protein